MNEPFFDNTQLIQKHGDWMRIQVAFYDFLFATALEMCPSCFNNIGLQEVIQGWNDDDNIYQCSVEAIVRKYPTFQDAWEAFININ